VKKNEQKRRDTKKVTEGGSHARSAANPAKDGARAEARAWKEDENKRVKGRGDYSGAKKRDYGTREGGGCLDDNGECGFRIMY